MSGKAIGISLVLIIIVAAAGYFIFITKPAMFQQQPATTTQSAAVASTTTDQVQAQDVTIGTGTLATPSSMVSVLYVGKLQDGTVFDSSAAHNNEPLTFQLGQQGLIPGFQIGVNGMKVGGERLLAIPASLGYGDQDVKDANGKVVIPANSMILFDVKLVKVADAPAAAPPAAPAKK